MNPEEVELIRRDYVANGGWETFLSYEDPRQDILVGLLRLRKVSGAAFYSICFICIQDFPFSGLDVHSSSSFEQNFARTYTCGCCIWVFLVHAA